MRGLRRCAALSILCSGCGLGWVDDPSGGGDNLPSQGAGPYGKLEIDFESPADEPDVVAVPDAHLSDPDALWRDDGGYRLWFGRHAGRNPAAIWSAELPALSERPDVAPAPALEATADWEADRVTAPSIVDLGGGHLVLFYEGGPAPAEGAPASDVRAIGRADSTDGGATWTRSARNPVLRGARAPAAAYVDGAWTLFVVRDTPGGSTIWRAPATDAAGEAFAIDEAGPAIAPRPDLAEAFDALAVDHPEIAVEETVAGQRHWSLFFDGTRPKDGATITAIGYAGSFDGTSWQRFAGPDPVLDDPQLDETGAAVVLSGSRGVLFASENRSSRSRIVAATDH
jgi:hypothetical protein